jgi:hypothetical protein
LLLLNLYPFYWQRITLPLIEAAWLAVGMRGQEGERAAGWLMRRRPQEATAIAQAANAYTTGIQRKAGEAATKKPDL